MEAMFLVEDYIQFIGNHRQLKETEQSILFQTTGSHFEFP